MRNKKGVAPLGIIVAGGIVGLITLFGVGRAVVTGQVEKPNWQKEKTVDTVSNPAPPHWENPL